MNFISPITITSTLITSCTLSEDPTAAWTSATYSVGDERHVVATHRVYKCAVAGSRTVSPELDPTNWVDMRPTNKMAPFDIYTSTAATSTTTDITYVFTARFCDSIALYGLEGSTYTISVKDIAGGSVIYTATGPLKTHAKGWFGYLFGVRTNVTRLIFTGIPIHPTAEMTVTISAGSGATRSVGMIVAGVVKALAGGGEWGGAQYGSSAEPVTYSYINTETDGTTMIVRRHKATNLNCKVSMPQRMADQAVESLQSVLDIPCAWFATSINGYDGLNTFGLAASSPVSYDNAGIASIDVNIKGLI